MPAGATDESDDTTSTSTSSYYKAKKAATLSNGDDNSTANGQPKPKRKPSRRNIFKPRKSRFDNEIVVSPHRGFHTFFWIFLSYYSIYTIYKNYKRGDDLVSTVLAYQFSENAWEFMTSELIMVLSCFLVVPIQKLVNVNLIPVKKAFIVQHLFQATWFFICVGWVFIKQWKWTQSGFFVMHVIVLWMKIHSYLSVNIEMKLKWNEHHHLKETRRKMISAMKDDDSIDDSADDNISLLDMEIEELFSDLRNENVCFPQNVTLFNFFDFLLVPTLVYELSYPRNQSFRPLYFLEKIVGIAVAFFLLYLTTSHHIIPILHDIPNLDFLDVLFHLLFPFVVMWAMVFFIIFEGICNALAEITLFADRNFYDSWWNSENFEEFARKWNIPVHEFLLRHVYLESIRNYKLSKRDATFVTFFLSSCLHELVIIVIGKRIRLWFFGFQMLQIPLIWISRFPIVRRQKFVGNVVFWAGMLMGPPLICTLYVREVFQNDEEVVL